jgi:hypothetical protein
MYRDARQTKHEGEYSIPGQENVTSVKLTTELHPVFKSRMYGDILFIFKTLLFVKLVPVREYGVSEK